MNVGRYVKQRISLIKQLTEGQQGTRTFPPFRKVVAVE